jgi:spermidine/putrescine-binding protein
MARPFQLTRRNLLVAGGATAGAALLPFGHARASVDQLMWSVWESNGDPAYSKAFEDDRGIDIRRAYMTSNDAQFAALRTGAARDWDIVNPSISEMRQYIGADLLQPLDLSQVPNTKHMYPVFANMTITEGPSGNTYGIPYLWGANPIVYRTDRIEGEPDYATLFDERYAGQISMRDYPLEAVAIGGIYVGVPREELFDMTAEQLAEAKKALMAQKKLVRSYWQSIGDLTNQFATGEVDLAFSWRAPYDALKDEIPIAMARPNPGVFGWCDCFALPTHTAGAEREAAYDFANYLLGPEYAMEAAMDGNYATSTNVIRDELSEAHRRDLFIEDLDVMNSFLWPTKPANYGEWLKLWTEVKAS